MSEIFTLPLQLQVGNLILIFLLPIVLAVCVGLVWVGLIRRNVGAAVLGVAFAAAVVVAGTWMRESALSSPNASPTLLATADGLAPFLPYGVGAGILIFLIVIVPGIVRAYRNPA